MKEKVDGERLSEVYFPLFELPIYSKTNLFSFYFLKMKDKDLNLEGFTDSKTSLVKLRKELVQIKKIEQWLVDDVCHWIDSIELDPVNFRESSTNGQRLLEV